MKSGLRLATKGRGQGPPVPVGDAGMWRLPGTGASAGSQMESYLRAYGQQGTVFSNVSLLASASAGPAWKLFRTAQDGRVRYATSEQGSDQRVEVVKHAALALLNRPNPFWSQFRLLEICQLWEELTGEWYWVVQRDPRSTVPTGLWPVRPDRMEPVPDPDTYLKGWVYTAPDGRERIPLLPSDVVFECLPNPLDLYRGMGPAQAVLSEIDGARYASEYNRNYFVNSARPDGVIQVDHRMTDDEWDEFTSRWRESHRGVARSHRVAVLEQGATWQQTGTNPKDMDFANLLSSGGDRIREAWGMHKVMTGITDDVNRANAQTGEEIFASWKIEPRLKRRRDTLNYQYLPLFGDTAKGVEFDYVLPMPRNREQDNLELTTKANAVSVLVNAGYDQSAVLEVVGLPDMGVVERPTQMPAVPPGWVPAPPAAPAADSADSGPADMQALLRRSMALLNRAGAR